MKVGKANYLVIRLGDNDYTTFAESLANALSAMFYLYDYPKTEADLELLKEPVARLWAALDIVNDVMKKVEDPKWPNTPDNFESIFYYMKSRISLKIVDFADLPDDDNHESICIPLFETEGVGYEVR
jgi:hypothetical protein